MTVWSTAILILDNTVIVLDSPEYAAVFLPIADNGIHDGVDDDVEILGDSGGIGMGETGSFNCRWEVLWAFYQDPINVHLLPCIHHHDRAVKICWVDSDEQGGCSISDGDRTDFVAHPATRLIRRHQSGSNGVDVPKKL
jgi:hypothetical protein